MVGQKCHKLLLPNQVQDCPGPLWELQGLRLDLEPGGDYEHQRVAEQVRLGILVYLRVWSVAHDRSREYRSHAGIHRD